MSSGELGQFDLAGAVVDLADRGRARSEADVQAGVRALLLYGGLDLVDPEVRLETPAPNRRRIDVETGLTVIECKKDLTTGNVREDAIDQLCGYVTDRTRELGQRYAGVLTDGADWELFHLSQSAGELQSVSRFRVDAADPDVNGLTVWLEGVLSSAEQLTPTPLEVYRRLGSEAPGSRLDLAELADVYAQCRDIPEVKMKRELWARLLSAALGSHFQDDDALFISHTYLVLTAEVIAHAVMSFDIGGSELTANDIITGAVFRRHDIHGVVEADFFDWPSHHEQGLAFVRGLATRLSRFDWADVEHDVLKVLYESVIDPGTRRQLGEYYTPDWLAHRIVVEIVDDPLNQRVLDPACGSGTFPFWAIRHFLEAADAAGMSNRAAVAAVTEHVFGIDLHPVAVTLARVTYLLAIGKTRLQDRDSLSIPIYLGDAIQYAQEARVLSPGGITIFTTDGLEMFAQELSFPEAVVADAGRFDKLVEELAHRAADRAPRSAVPPIRAIMNRHEVPPEAREQIEETFRVLCHLHDNGRDHIWGYYVRNLARPLEFTREAHRVDRLVGNPPWLRYNGMTAQLQAEFKRLSQQRGLWAASHVVTSQDLAGLFAARACELYLRVGGRFGFVMPGSTLSRQQYAGFRTGRFSNPDTDVVVQFGRPWELSRVIPQPFPVPAAVVFGQRAQPPSASQMPEEALWWSGRVPDHHRGWDAVAEQLQQETGPVVVADGSFASPYGALAVQGANLVPRVLLTVVEQPATALGVPAGRIAIKSDRSSPEREPWSDVETLTGVVEEQFVYPIILGESLMPYRVRRTRTAVLPTDGQALFAANDLLIDAHPGLAAWWRNAERVYNQLKPTSTRHDLLGQINYQSKLVKQFPSAPHRVAYTGRGAITTAARISDPRVVVDHALYWLPVASAEEAAYVTAVLNADALHRRIEGALSQGLFGGRNIHRVPFRLFWPEYDPTVPDHVALAEASLTAELVVEGLDVAAGERTAAARHKARETLLNDGVGHVIEEMVDSLLEASSSDSPV